MERLKDLADQMKEGADNINGELRLDQAEKMLVLSKCIESLLTGFIIKHKIKGASS